MANESISEVTKKVDGNTEPLWSREEMNEIIIGQVFCVSTLYSINLSFQLCLSSI